MLDELRIARSDYSVIWKEFLEEFSKCPDKFFFFFEGEDEKYYGIRISIRLPFISEAEKISFNCKGKDSVLKIFDLLSSNEIVGNSLSSFFIDKDFDNNSRYEKEDMIFITDKYSIENYYVSVEVFNRILESEFKQKRIGNNKEIFDKISAIYKTRLEEFLDALDLLIAFILKLRERGLKNSNSLDNFEISKMTEIKIEKIKKKYSFDDIKKILNCVIDFSESDVLKIIRDNQLLDRESFYRGKYIIEFLRIFLDRLREDLIKSKPTLFNEKKALKLNLSRVNIISELSQYADTPACLFDFLDNLAKRRKSVFESKSILN